MNADGNETQSSGRKCRHLCYMKRPRTRVKSSFEVGTKSVWRKRCATTRGECQTLTSSSQNKNTTSGFSLQNKPRTTLSYAT